MDKEPGRESMDARSSSAGPTSGAVLSDEEVAAMADALLRLWRMELDQFALFADAVDPDEAFAAAEPYFVAGHKLANRILAAASFSAEGTRARLMARAHTEGHDGGIMQRMELGPPSAAVRELIVRSLAGNGLIWEPGLRLPIAAARISSR